MKKYGCIGERLGHSFSKEVHNALADYNYELIEIPKSELEGFATSKDFTAINVTIPYKEQIIPYLYKIDAHAKSIGAVNTVVNRDGKLYGYNTDFYGMEMLLLHAGIELSDKKVAILGSGGTAKTAFAVATAKKAKTILRVSRSKKENVITYDELYSYHGDVEIIINTTPVGMFPDISSSPIDISRFPRLTGVIDAVYNPLSTELIRSAKERGISAEGGLYMLVAQAVRASEIFLDKKYTEEEMNRVFNKIYTQKQNIVLIGMPACGKSTVGKILSQKLSRDFFDSDTLIEEKCQKKISDIFSESGEKSFRDAESEVVAELSARCGAVIATGGGAILRKSNVSNLSKNGKIYFIDRPLNKLIPTDDRPLSKNYDDIKKRYEERYDIYRNSADVIISADASPELVAEQIIGDFLNENIRN